MPRPPWATWPWRRCRAVAIDPSYGPVRCDLDRTHPADRDHPLHRSRQDYAVVVWDSPTRLEVAPLR